MLVPAEGWRQNQQNKSTTGSLSSTDGNTNAMFLVPRQLEVVRSPGTRCCSVTRSCLTLCNPMDHSMKGFPVLHYLLEFAQTRGHWVNDANQPSHPVTLFSCPQSFPVSGSFLMSQLFLSSGWSIGASASVLPMDIQGWFSLGLTGLISLLFKGLSRVFSSTTVRKHQFFGAQPSLWFNSHICTLKNHSLQSDVSAF